MQSILNTYLFFISESIEVYRKCQIPKELQFKVGCKVIVTRNLYNGLVNGIGGKITDMNSDSIEMQVDAEDDYPKKLHHKKFILDRYTYLLRDDNNKVYAERKQFPIKIGYAVTVDKSQGRTLNKVIVDCADFWRAGQLGVAVGRARSKAGLQVLNYNTIAANLRHGEHVNKFCMQRGIKMRNDDSCCKTELVEPIEEPLFPLIHVPDENWHDAEHLMQTRSNVAVKRNFPWKVTDFLMGLCEINATDFQKKKRALLKEVQHRPSIKVFLQEMYSIVKHMYDDYKVDRKGKKCKASFLTKHMHTYTTSKTFEDKCIVAFNVKQASRMLNHVGADIVFGILRRIVNEEGEAEREANFQRQLSNGSISLAVDANLQAVIRYVAGASVQSVSKYYQTILRRTKNHSKKKEYNYYSLRIISSLRQPQGHVEKCTKDAISVNHVVQKQGKRQSLTHIGDDVLEFFKQLHINAVPFINNEMLLQVGDKCLDAALKSLQENDALLRHWCSLFVNIPSIARARNLQENDSEDTDDESDGEVHLQQAIILDLYQKICTYFCRVLFSECRSQVLNEQRTKKQAHRAALQSQSSSINESSSNNIKYPCAVCANECKDLFENFDEQSVQCTSCKVWIHFPCAGLTGDEEIFDEGHEDDDWLCRPFTQDLLCSERQQECNSEVANERGPKRKPALQLHGRRKHVKLSCKDKTNDVSPDDSNHDKKLHMTSRGRIVKSKKPFNA